MEEYGNTVIRLHATLFQNISKFTRKTNQNISKTTQNEPLIRTSSLLPRERQLFPGGCVEMFFAFGLRGSELLMPLGRCLDYLATVHVCDRQPLLSQVCYRAATPLPTASPTFTESYRLFTDLSDFLGRLQPSKTTTHETLGTLGVEESTSWVIRWNITRNSTKGVLLVTIVD